MQKQGGESGQTVVVGTLLVFALLVGFLVYLQVSFFPAKNEQAEQIAYESAVQDMLELDDAIQRSLTFNEPASKTILTLVTYPTQVAEPYNPSEQLVFQDVQSAVRVGNSNTTVPWNTDTEFIVYRPDYIEFSSAPNITYEYSIVATESVSSNTRTTIAKSSQSIIRNTTITVPLTTYDNQVLQTENPQLLATVSDEYQYEYITNDTNSDITFTIKTRLTSSTWKSLLRSERVENGGHITSIQYEQAPNPNEVTISLESGIVYEVRWARVKLSST